MPDVDHKVFRVRVLVEQVVSAQESGYASNPLDSGRRDKVIVHEERTYEISDSEFSAFIKNPIKSLIELHEYETNQRSR